MRRSDPAYGLEQYEGLRRQALDAAASSRQGLGLVLFLRRGMSAWLVALSALESPPPPRSRGGEPSAPLVPASYRAELVTLLAGMVMACNEEVRP